MAHSSKRIRFRSVWKRGYMFYIICLSLILILGIIIILYDTNRFVIKQYRIKSKKIRGKHRYVFLSDLHNKVYGKDNASLLLEIDRIKPEAILIGGDMLTSKPGKDFTPASSLVKNLANKYPVYYANGNHEYRIRIYEDTYGDLYKNYEEMLTQAGIVRLVNEKKYLEDSNILLSGLEIDRKYYKRFRHIGMEETYLEELLGAVDENVFTILFAHNPDYFAQYVKYGVDLVLSGHVHGGIARLPFIGGVISPSFRLFPKYDGGFFKENGTSMVLSKGLGVHTIPIRFLNPGELIVLDLQEG